MGGLYVAELAGAGRGAAVAAAAAMVAAVVLANARGLSTTARMQLALSALLALLLAVAVVFALPAGRAEHWTPFAPHGWTAVGSAASLLMFSFIGWEAVSHLAGELPDPARQLPRAAFGALAVVAVLYLGLAVAMVGVLGAGEPSSVPLADLMEAGLGAPGRAATLFVAVLLTVGTMSTYVAAAVNLAGALVGPRMPRGRALAIFGGATAVLLVALATGVAGVEGLIRASSAAFVAVYLPATGAGVRLLRGRARAAALVAVSAIAVVLAFAGPFILVPAVVAVAVAAAALPGRLSSSRSARRGPRARRRGAGELPLSRRGCGAAPASRGATGPRARRAEPATP